MAAHKQFIYCLIDYNRQAKILDWNDLGTYVKLHC